MGRRHRFPKPGGGLGACLVHFTHRYVLARNGVTVFCCAVSAEQTERNAKDIVVIKCLYQTFQGDPMPLTKNDKYTRKHSESADPWHIATFPLTAIPLTRTVA